jgi:hypothetical protein
VLQRVADRLHPDEAVAEHEGVDAVLHAGRGGVRGPFQEQDVALVDLGLQIPGRVRDVREQLGERRPDALLTTQDAGRADEDGVVGVVGDDFIQVTGTECLGVVLEDFLRGAWRRRIPFRA